LNTKYLIRAEGSLVQRSDNLLLLQMTIGSSRMKKGEVGWAGWHRAGGEGGEDNI